MANKVSVIGREYDDKVRVNDNANMKTRRKIPHQEKANKKRKNERRKLHRK